MGIFHEYIAKGMDPKQIETERNHHLGRIGQLLGSDVMTYAARLSATPAPLPTAVMYEDLLPFVDLLDGLEGPEISIILETHGGAGEIGRQMVEVLHERFETVRFVVPGTAKSTGTIMVLGGHEILMGPGSSLGPIDAQLQQDGKTYSADALIEGLNRIKREVVENNGELNPAYIPFLQKLSPGEIEHAHNALEFARETVREWLIRYKFGKWKVRETSGEPVTAEYKTKRADEIARALASQRKWKTHGRSLMIADLRKLGLKIRDFSESADLYDAIQRYHVLLRMTFEGGNVYKLFETPHAIIAKRFNVQPAPGQQGLPAPDHVGSIHIGMKCNLCGAETKVQLDFQEGLALQEGAVQYPTSGQVSCGNCGEMLDVRPAREQIEQQIGRRALDPQPER